MSAMLHPVPHAVEQSAAERLRRDLESTVAGEVRFDAGSRALYSAEASNYRQVPIGVVIPKTVDDIVSAVSVCHRHGVPVLPRGGGTSQNGQCVNVAVVIDASKYLRRVLSIDSKSSVAFVEPGVVCDALRDAAEEFNLTFAPDPATHSRCTLGGMIGNNSCGAHSVMAGKTVENVEALEILTYDGARFWVGPTSPEELSRIIAGGGRQGEIYARLKALGDKYADLIRARYPKIRRRVSGYNLDQLLPENGFNVARALVGTEGTCVTVLQAKVTLVHSPPARVLLVLGFPNIYLAGDAVPEFMPFGPIAAEGLDKETIFGMRARDLCRDEIALLPAGEAWVLTEFGDFTLAGAIAKARAAAEYFKAKHNVSTLLVEDPALQRRIWLVRETGASATALGVGDENDNLVGWEDAAVDPNRLGDYLRAFQALIDRYGYRTSLYGHFGDGCVHARIDFDLRSHDGVQKWRRFLREAAELVVQFGGSLSGEHGDGQAKAEFLPVMYGAELVQAMREFKEIWDPQHKMNPGKVVNPYRADENLRQGPDYRPPQLLTRMKFNTPEGEGFTRQMDRCIGAARCRQQRGATMCPSYRATREERFSTRGRARLLFEMVQGEVIKDGWDSVAVREALDTCLSCKGCRHDCPTHTDVASYKAEFLSHYHENRARPRQAYFFGMIGRWAPKAAPFAFLVNALTRVPGIAALSKWIAGAARQRDLPRFAPRRFSASAPTIGQTGKLERDVLLWVDTFCDHFHPEIAEAAVKVLNAAGCRVLFPAQRLCCGRPLYDYGMLDKAREELSAVLDALEQTIAEGIPLVGLEPSCLSVFRDEMLQFFPDDARAKRLAAQTYLFADYLNHVGYQPPAMQANVLLHGHCHQKALFGMTGESELLGKLGVTYKLLDNGCCGMAGGFGFDRRYYGISQKIGEHELFPALRAAAPGTVVVSSGFSCREQIAQGTPHRPLHIAELLARAVEA